MNTACIGAVETPVELHVALEGVDLPAERVAAHGHVDAAEGLLVRRPVERCGRRAGSSRRTSRTPACPARSAARSGSSRLEGPGQLVHRGRLAARQHRCRPRRRAPRPGVPAARLAPPVQQRPGARARRPAGRARRSSGPRSRPAQPRSPAWSSVGQCERRSTQALDRPPAGAGRSSPTSASRTSDGAVAVVVRLGEHCRGDRGDQRLLLPEVGRRQHVDPPGCAPWSSSGARRSRQSQTNASRPPSKARSSPAASVASGERQRQPAYVRRASPRRSASLPRHLAASMRRSPLAAGDGRPLQPAARATTGHRRRSVPQCSELGTGRRRRHRECRGQRRRAPPDRCRPVQPAGR